MLLKSERENERKREKNLGAIDAEPNISGRKIRTLAVFHPKP